MRTPPAYPVRLRRSQLEGIGRFFVIWNQVELFMHLTVCICLELELQTSEVIMGTTRGESKSEIFRIVCREKLRERQELVGLSEEICGDLSSLSQFRNDLAHGRWSVPDQLNEEIFGMRTLKPDARRFNLQDLDAKLKVLSILSNKAAHFFSKRGNLSFRS